jgi:hypothetical protein
LFFITPDAVRGVIEVKSRLQPSSFADTVERVARTMRLVRGHPNGTAFSGILAFADGGGGTEAYLAALRDKTRIWDERIDCAAIGEHRLIRYWNEHPDDERRLHYAWHSYACERSAFGYFVHSVVEAVAPYTVASNKLAWFPAGGQETTCDGVQPSAWKTE